MTLHDELSRLADSAPRPVIDHTVWDRGRALRRRDRWATSALVLALALVMGGLTSLALGHPRSIQPAGDVVPDGAIPSRIVDAGTDSAAETDFAIGRGSVAFISATGSPVVITATDGHYHYLDVDAPLALALSPDGRQLAWAMPDRVSVADLESGDVLDFTHNAGRGAQVQSLLWQTDSQSVIWQGTDDEGQPVAATLNPSGPSEEPIPVDRLDPTWFASPTKSVWASASTAVSPVVEFHQPDPARGFNLEDWVDLPRALPADLYPSGATSRPLGWASDHLLLAELDAPTGSYVEGRHLALLTSPDRPESEWTFRVVMRNVPDVADLSVAADLIPDLDGTSSQQFTHDFGEPGAGGPARLPLILGGGLALLATLTCLVWLHRRGLR